MPLSRIFVSYMQKGDERGSEVARLLISDLKINGAELITDNEAIPDESFVAFLNRELPLCHYLIFVQTPLALKSLRVQTVVNIAITLVAQQRMRGVLYLLATPSEQTEALPGPRAAYTFDASTDYPRARDKLFLAMNLIEMDKNASILAPSSGGWNTRPPALPPLLPPTGQARPPMTIPPVPPDMDLSSPTSRAKRPALFSWPLRMFQRHQQAPAGKQQVDALNTLLEDRPPPLNTTRQKMIRWGGVLALLLVLILGTTLTLARIHQPTGKKQTPSVVIQHPSPTTVLTTAVTGTPSPGATTGVKLIDPQSKVDTYALGTTLVLADDMTGNDAHYQWQTGASGPNSCTFSKNGYAMISTGPNYCLANQSNFSDFVYQIQMKIVQGTTGGVIFRATENSQTYYYFQITTAGQTSLWRSDSSNKSPTLLPHSSSFAAAIEEGEGQPNVIAISALGSHLICYVNGVPLVSITDTHYTAGNIGVMVGQPNTTSVTEALYQFARVWTR